MKIVWYFYILLLVICNSNFFEYTKIIKKNDTHGSTYIALQTIYTKHPPMNKINTPTRTTLSKTRKKSFHSWTRYNANAIYSIAQIQLTSKSVIAAARSTGNVTDHVAEIIPFAYNGQPAWEYKKPNIIITASKNNNHYVTYTPKYSNQTNTTLEKWTTGQPEPNWKIAINDLRENPIITPSILNINNEGVIAFSE